LGKIFYGLLYKELLLLRNRASKSKVPIVKRQLLKTFDLHQVFLQSARLSMKFVPALPASIFVFKIAEVKDNRLQWDFRDSPQLQNPLQGFSLKPIFDKWNQYEFAKVLAGMTGYPLEQIFSPPAGVVSWLHDVTGKIKLQPVPELAPIRQ
jgi:hypothetical protein